MVRTVALTALRRVLGVLGLGPTPDVNEVEIAVLRPQLAVLQRQVVRPIGRWFGAGYAIQGYDRDMRSVLGCGDVCLLRVGRGME